ncbi:hypothetical protein DFQ27_003758 [Actinomortierella ambigua]|uniref:Uncharacterized protein n=1 Tax=Actinomortierella ambigua TaxID=1343610 RepID=A0A9P6Q5U8_9FUNG|nr:hypothetical protein DFQ27_003758 [Actinomortierella ambigua]
MMALRFVERFTQHHGRGQLKTAKFVNLPSWNPHLDECLEIETRIQQMVGPPTNITTINGTNWSTLLSFADILDLSSIGTWLSDPDVFKWAVKEQVSHKSIGEPQTLVPLQVLNCVCRNDIMETICDDIIQAFGETLEVLNLFPGSGEVIPELKIGGRWWSSLVLRSVNIASLSAIVIHPDAFKATPALEHLYL